MNVASGATPEKRSVPFQAMHMCGPAAGIVLVLSLRAGLWLIALGVVAAVAVLLRRERQDRRHWLPALLAVRAVSTGRPSDDIGRAVRHLRSLVSA